MNYEVAVKKNKETPFEVGTIFSAKSVEGLRLIVKNGDSFCTLNLSTHIISTDPYDSLEKLKKVYDNIVYYKQLEPLKLECV